MKGYTGRILFVNLSTGSIKEENPSEKTYRNFIGGFGLSAKILYENIKPKVNPLGPDNMLGFMTGPLTGMPVPWAARWTVAAKSPLTGTWGDANAGGYFGVEMKAAGYDGVFFSGISRKPVYLWLSDGKAELREASHLWGKDTTETQNILQKELGDKKVRTACIGQASETLSLISGIVTDKGRVAARGGLGAVMGSKRLKAIAVRGHKKLQIANEVRFKEIRKKMIGEIKKLSEFKMKFWTPEGYIEIPHVAFYPNYSTCNSLSGHVVEGSVPLKNWQMQGEGEKGFPTHAKISGTSVTKYRKRKFACPNCMIACGGILDVKSGPFAVKEAHQPEYETLASFGTNCLIDDVEAIIKANDDCNRYGLDTISAGATIAFAMECYQRGIITKEDTEGLELVWGNAKAMLALLEKMGKREGIGAIFADGSAKAAERLGKGSEEWAVHFRGMEPGNYDPRVWPTFGMLYAYDPSPGRHTHGDLAAYAERGYSLTVHPDLETPPVDIYDFDSKDRAQMYSTVISYDRVMSASGACMFSMALSTYPLPELISSVTGWDFKVSELLKTGLRIQTMRHLFNVREGLTVKDFTIPKRFKKAQKIGPVAGITVDFDSLRRRYFEGMGWDTETGVPTRQTLRELGLDNIHLAT